MGRDGKEEKNIDNERKLGEGEKKVEFCGGVRSKREGRERMERMKEEKKEYANGKRAGGCKSARDKEGKKGQQREREKGEEIESKMIMYDGESCAMFLCLSDVLSC